MVLLCCCREACILHMLYMLSKIDSWSALVQACSQGFNSCILASPSIDPTQLLRRVMPLLAPSASFALFSNWLQPLADCMFKLQVCP